MAHAVELRLTDGATGVDGGTVVDVWDGYDFALDMLHPGNAWSFDLWHSVEGDTPELAAQRRTAWAVLNRTVKVGGAVVLAIDGAPQLNGRIEQVEYLTDRDRGARIVLSGRDMAAPALDWDADPRITLRGRALEEVLGELFNRVGVPVLIGASAEATRLVQSRRRPGTRGGTTTRTRRRQTVDLAHARPGESVWQVADSICKRMGLLMWIAPSEEAPLGLSLIVDTPGYARRPAFTFQRRLVDGTADVTADSNILESRFCVQIHSVPTVVYAAGRALRGDAAPSRTRVAYTNDQLARWPIVASPLPPQPRWLHTARARDPATARQEAARVMAEAMADFRVYECTVQGHGQPLTDGVNDGTVGVYCVNTMARVYDRVGGFTLLDEDMLMTAVRFVGGREAGRRGQHTRVTLGTVDAIALTPAS